MHLYRYMMHRYVYNDMIIFRVSCNVSVSPVSHLLAGWGKCQNPPYRGRS